MFNTHVDILEKIDGPISLCFHMKLSVMPFVAMVRRMMWALNFY